MPPHDTLRIRHADAADNRLLAEVGAETFAETFGPDNAPENMATYLAASFGPAKQAAELADSAVRFLIAERDGAVVGYAKLKFEPAPAAVGGARPMEICRLYARTAWIGQGIGARLMQACLDEAAAAGCDRVWLDVWSRNPRAIDFYRRWGFEIVGSATFWVGHDPQDDYLMARPVTLAAVRGTRDGNQT
jgi:ribosomal protein S18 acetylase RimI-like enzyme